MHCSGGRCNALKCERSNSLQWRTVQTALQYRKVQCTEVAHGAMHFSDAWSKSNCGEQYIAVESCSAVQCHVVPCGVFQCRSVACSAVQLSAVSCSAVQWHLGYTVVWWAAPWLNRPRFAPHGAPRAINNNNKRRPTEGVLTNTSGSSQTRRGPQKHIEILSNTSAIGPHKHVGVLTSKTECSQILRGPHKHVEVLTKHVGVSQTRRVLRNRSRSSQKLRGTVKYVLVRINTSVLTSTLGSSQTNLGRRKHLGILTSIAVRTHGEDNIQWAQIKVFTSFKISNELSSDFFLSISFWLVHKFIVALECVPVPTTSVG